MHSRSLPLLSGAVMLAAVLAAAPAVPGADDAAADAVAAANTAFALDLYRQLSPAPGNLVFSPYSISDVLGMVQVGARGQTATEMAGVLHLDLPASQIAAGFAGLAGRLDAAGNDQVALVIANSVWVQQQTPLSAEYLKLLQTQFRAAAAAVDFLHAADAARVTINDWVADQTRGKITELIGAGVLDAQTRMVLGNAIYFKGRWAHQFDTADTKSAAFHLSPPASVMVPMMEQTAKFRTVPLAGFQLLELPYEGQELSMVIVLPDADDGLPAIERQLSSDNLHAWLARLDASPDGETGVYLPRFSATQSVRLEQQLAVMGLRSALNPATADFSGMTGDRSLVLSAVIHKAVVEVNEEGTVAAASTGGIMKLGVTMPHDVRVDHPFLFLIRDHATATVLFLGRIVDPR